eukprot:UN21730
MILISKKDSTYTGISGMIGSHLARELAHNPCLYKIYGIIRPRSDLSALRGIIDLVELLYGDITDYNRMEDIM